MTTPLRLQEPAQPVREMHSPWAVAILLALAAAAGGILLTGVSAWFLGAVALAGAGPAALTFNFHTPAAFVRLFALGKTGAKYGERVFGHRAALLDQVRRRAALFGAMAAAPRTRAVGWQLGHEDRLADYMDDVEDRDSERLRVGLPLLTLIAGYVALIAATACAAPVALIPIGLLSAAIGNVAFWLEPRAAADWDDVRREQRAAVRLLGAGLAALVPLKAERSFGGKLSRAFSRFVAAEHARFELRTALAAIEGAGAPAGALAAASVILAAWFSGARQEALLLPVLLGFSWLAFAELVQGAARIVLGNLRARAAGDNLAAWTASPQSGEPLATAPLSALRLAHVPRCSPDGREIGDAVDLTLRAGAPTLLTGASGSGKTSLLKQIAGWIGDDRNGRILADGVVLLGASRRARVHLCLHDAAVLSDTVRANLFAPEASDGECWQALRAVELDARIAAAGGLDAWIAQDMLSLGEAQRLNLARALLSTVPVVLLDEPTEHLDAEQSERILARLCARLTGRIVVYASHAANAHDAAAATVAL